MKMRKGFVEEMIWIVTIIAATLMIVLFFYMQQSSNIEVRKTVEERVTNEEGISLLFSLSSDKPPHVERYYAQILVDSVLEGVNYGKRTDQAFYGNGIGTVNMTEIIPVLVEKFTNKNWKMSVITPAGTHVYGDITSGKFRYSYEILIPVPEERLGKIVFELS